MASKQMHQFAADVRHHEELDYANTDMTDVQVVRVRGLMEAGRDANVDGAQWFNGATVLVDNRTPSMTVLRLAGMHTEVDLLLCSNGWRVSVRRPGSDAPEAVQQLGAMLVFAGLLARMRNAQRSGS